MRKEGDVVGKTSTQVKNAWNAANYKTYTISLRRDADAELIDFVEQFKAARDGIGVTEIFRLGISALMENEKQ